MERWKEVKWTTARQLTSILGWPAGEHDEAPPESYFARLRDEGRHHEAAMFLGQALPRFEAVAWATRSVRDLTPPQTPPAEAEALKAALLWLQDPSETRRRAAFEAASAASGATPQRLCALAVFFSGGSLAPDNVQPVPAPKETAGKFAAGAVIAAATASDNPAQALDTALKFGETLEAGGDAARP